MGNCVCGVCSQNSVTNVTNVTNADVSVRDYKPAEGEQLFSPESYQLGVLLLRPNGSFAYVHDDQALLSEGVQGRWIPQIDNKVRLEPESFGWCYQTFAENEIIGVCHTVTLHHDQANTKGRSVCTLPEKLLGEFSWIDPTLPEVAEPLAQNYKPDCGEQLYSPESYRAGVLLLRSDSTFAYVHDASAKFSDGVQGHWSQELESTARLMPESFGYCYEETFDANEIVGVCHTVTLRQEQLDTSGRFVCVLPDALRSRFSWLDPTREEVIEPSNCSDQQKMLEADGAPPRPAPTPRDYGDECPNSPKYPARRGEVHSKEAEDCPNSPRIPRKARGWGTERGQGRLEEVDDCPNSPKVPARSRRTREKRA